MIFCVENANTRRRGWHFLLSVTVAKLPSALMTKKKFAKSSRKKKKKAWNQNSSQGLFCYSWLSSWWRCDVCFRLQSAAAEASKEHVHTIRVCQPAGIHTGNIYKVVEHWTHCLPQMISVMLRKIFGAFQWWHFARYGPLNNTSPAPLSRSLWMRKSITGICLSVLAWRDIRWRSRAH